MDRGVMRQKDGKHLGQVNSLSMLCQTNTQTDKTAMALNTFYSANGGLQDSISACMLY